MSPNRKSVSNETAAAGLTLSAAGSLRKARPAKRPGKCPWCGGSHWPHFTSQIEQAGAPVAGIKSHEAVAGFAPHETGLPSQRAAPGSSLLFGPGLDPPDPLADHNALIAATSAVLKDARRRWDTAIYKTGLLAAKAAGSSDHLRRPDTGDASPVSCSSPPPIGPYEAELRRVILSFGPPPKGSSLFPEMEP